MQNIVIIDFKLNSNSQQVFKYLREQGHDIPTRTSLLDSDNIISICKREMAMVVLKQVRDGIEHVFQLDEAFVSNLDALKQKIHFSDTITGTGCIFNCWSKALQKLEDLNPISPADLRMAVVSRIKQIQDPVLRIWYLNQHAQRRRNEAHSKHIRSRTASDRFSTCCTWRN